MPAAQGFPVMACDPQSFAVAAHLNSNLVGTSNASRANPPTTPNNAWVSGSGTTDMV
jgi:hypothetical protein